MKLFNLKDWNIDGTNLIKDIGILALHVLLIVISIVFIYIIVVCVVYERVIKPMLGADENAVTDDYNQQVKSMVNATGGIKFGSDSPSEEEYQEYLGMAEGSTSYLPGENYMPLNLERYDYFSNPENKYLKDIAPQVQKPPMTAGEQKALKMYLGAGTSNELDKQIDNQVLVQSNFLPGGGPALSYIR